MKNKFLVGLVSISLLNCKAKNQKEIETKFIACENAIKNMNANTDHKKRIKDNFNNMVGSDKSKTVYALNDDTKQLKAEQLFLDSLNELAKLKTEETLCNDIITKWDAFFQVRNELKKENDKKK